jgi:hypothetical protein
VHFCSSSHAELNQSMIIFAHFSLFPCIAAVIKDIADVLVSYELRPNTEFPVIDRFLFDRAQVTFSDRLHSFRPGSSSWLIIRFLIAPCPFVPLRMACLAPCVATTLGSSSAAKSTASW